MGAASVFMLAYVLNAAPPVLDHLVGHETAQLGPAKRDGTMIE